MKKKNIPAKFMNKPAAVKTMLNLHITLCQIYR